MRPVDLARERGLSTQAVRNYEEAGILPRADRTASGYRFYDALHWSALKPAVMSPPPSTSGHRRQRYPKSLRGRSVHCVFDERVGCA